MKKIKTTHYYDEVYLVNYVFLLNVKNDKEIESILKKKYKGTYDWYMSIKDTTNVSIEKCGGKNIQGIHRQIIIIKKDTHLSDAEWHGILAHECLHAAMNITSTRGVTHNEENTANEYLTYYMEMLIRMALKNK